MPTEDKVWFAGRWRTPEGVQRKKAAQRRYDLSEQGKAVRRKSEARYRKTNKGYLRDLRHRLKLKKESIDRYQDEA